jgi:hypothetical protein
MKTQEWKFEDTRRFWLPDARDRSGPWDDEPDKRQWTSESRWNGETGIPCLIVRNHFGALCGYVGLPKGHPWYGVEYEDVEVRMTHDALTEDVEFPHGGLTFSGKCSTNDPERGVCHVVESGEPDDVWWLGFDCAHAFDTVPGLNHVDYGDSEYRNFDYVRVECEKLAALAAMLSAKHGVQGS